VQIITLDFETYFSKDYTLKSPLLNTSEYIRHEEFKAQCVGIKINEQPVAWYKDADVATAISSIDWPNSALLAHNCAFDGFILSHHYNVVPAYYFDTLSMARALHSNAIKANLNAVAQFYKLGNKLPDILDKTKGVKELPADLMQQLGTYCAVDVELCRMIFDEMKPGFPQDELNLIDLTLRMFCTPSLLIDIPRVQNELKREQDEKEQTIQKAGVPLGILSSADKFASELQSRGITPPTKLSPRTNRTTWAFSKTDLDFINLKYHPDSSIRDLVAARLAAKSTIGESRAQRFLSVGASGRRLPVLLNYFGAHTGRWSAGNKMNLQNLKRGGELRKSIIAPEGHVLVVTDSAQIEARVTAWLASDDELLSLFAKGEDVYKHMASQIYRKPVEDITKDERFIGKIAILGLGYGMGWKKFQHTLATGAMGPVVEMNDSDCQRIVGMYRAARLPIAKLWRDMDAILYRMVMKRVGEYGPLRYDEACRIWMPNGLYLQYPFLTADMDPNTETLVDYRYYDYETGVKRILGCKISKDDGKKIYGGLLTENVVQALSRIIVGEQMLKIAVNLKETGSIAPFGANPDVGVIRKIVTMTHDEIVTCVPEEEADDTLGMMLTEMRTPPKWCANIPLNAEGGYDRNYSK